MWIKQVSHPRSHPSTPMFLLRRCRRSAASQERIRERSLWVHFSINCRLFPQPPDSPKSPHRTRMQDKPPSLCSDGFPPIRICGTIHHSATQKLQSRRTGLGNNNIANTLQKNVSESLTKVRSSAGLSFPQVILFSRTPNCHWSGTRTVTQKPLILRR